VAHEFELGVGRNTHLAVETGDFVRRRRANSARGKTVLDFEKPVSQGEVDDQDRGCPEQLGAELTEVAVDQTRHAGRI